MFGDPELSVDWRPGAAAAGAGHGAGPSSAPGIGDHPRVEVGAVLSVLRALGRLPAPTAAEAKRSGVGDAVLAVCRHPIPLLAGAARALLRRWQGAELEGPMRQAAADEVRG